MKSSPSLRKRFIATTIGIAAIAVLARAELPLWMQTAVSGSAIEAALYRAMDLPGIHVLFPRPPAESRTQLDALLKSTPTAQLYALRAHAEEQSLDFSAAEHDWTAYVASSTDKAAANFELADYYQRRNEAPQQIAALEAAATIPTPASEQFLPADQQRAWQAFPRDIKVAQDQALDDDAILAIHHEWIARYPTEPAARAALIRALLTMHRYDDAQRAIDDYKQAFPQDQVFPIKAAALLAFDQGTKTATQHALDLFDKSYQPLWPADLTSTYLQLLDATHTQHAMLAASRAALVTNPDDLAAATKLFAYYQQQGHSDTALGIFAAYAASKQARHTAWSADELYTIATLLDRAQQYEAAAHYDYALATAPGHLTASQQSPEEAALCGIIHILLTAPDQPIAIGAGNLSIYSDLATTDRGPGYLNGILSLWLNSASPGSEFNDEESKATPYFHRAKAEELLAVLDQRFPASPQRAALHAQLIQADITYGDDASVQTAGQHFLTDFPHASERLQIALAVANVDARTKNTTAEFALYDSLLTELAAPLQGMPLTAGSATPSTPPTTATPDADATTPDVDADTTTPATPSATTLLQQSLNISANTPPATANAAAYRQILDRYLDRLITTNQQPAALAVLRKELDRNPNDPLLYERLADFLQQNNLDAQQEEVYKQALARFNSDTFYDKLARLYLRKKRQQDFDTLTRKVVDIFQGSELQSYFANVDNTWPQEYLQLNLYAHKRFPHQLVFTRNILNAYRARTTTDPAAYDQLLREHWQESPDLQSEFFATLARSSKLNDERAALEALLPAATPQPQNTAATFELAELHLWQSHFEQSAPLLASLAEAYPADTIIGDQAGSVFRSLAYFDPTKLTTAIIIAKHLSAADPNDLDRLATIGDIYANSTSTSLNLDTNQQLTQAAPFFRRIAAVHPGLSDGYLQSATVFWDYFQFDDALAQITAARKHFNDPALYAYQAGAIDEGKRDYPHAITEYIAASTDTDATNQQDAHSRLLELASRKDYAALVDDATARLADQSPNVAALQLRFDVLNTLHRQQDISPLVEAAITRASTEDALASLAAFAQSHQLDRAYISALQRQIAITTDSVHRIELQYQLVQAYLDQKNIPAAATLIDSVHKDNSRLVGVVRRTVDFYWQNNQQPHAIATLSQASHEANPALAHDYTLEAIDKSNHSGDYAGARLLLKPLLTADPYNAQYLNLQAQSFSLAHDAAGVRDLYTATITALQATPTSVMDATTRRNKIALARQALIPALTDLKDYEGATDQHIALISAFPEDDPTLSAAIAYARFHSREQQLTTFLNKAVADSPRDSRFAIDLGRVDVQFEDYAGALAAYSKAIAIRRDRPDLFIARADLEEHQQNFDAACADYDRLYLLTYHDPQWMEKAALARARQGKPDLAVKALQAAWIDGRPPTADSYFRVAQQLETWNLLPQADTFAAQGIELAGSDLLTTSQDHDGAVLYARLLARERKASDAFTFFAQQLQSVNTSASAPSVIAQQVQQRGLAAVTDADWRKALVAARQQQAKATCQAALLQIASVVADLYTPEEKSAFATLLDAQRTNRPPQEVADLWIPMAHAASLSDREAAWRRDLLLHGGKLAPAQLNAFNELEIARMDNVTRAQTLDAYALTLKPKSQTHVLSLAAKAWRDAGDTPHEITDLRKLVLAHQQQQFQDRLFTLYLRGNRDALLQLVSANDTTSDAAGSFVVTHGDEALALKAVTARASNRPSVWNTANTALLGLYFADKSSTIDTAFATTLGDPTIGAQLTNKPDERIQLSGDPWFYYGSRYGLFLALNNAPSHPAEDYLPSQIELASSDPASYTALAQTYLDAQNTTAAIAEYRHVIELVPSDPTPDIAIAEALWQTDRHDEALASWSTALTKLRTMVDLRAVPESFWTNIATISSDANHLGIATQLKPGLDLVLAAYLRKNGSYRADELLHSDYDALSAQSPSAAAASVLALIDAAPVDAREEILSTLITTDVTWLSSTELEPFFLRAISLAQTSSANHNSDANSSTDSDADTSTAQSSRAAIQVNYIKWLFNQSHTQQASSLLTSLPADQRHTPDLQIIAIRIAAKLSYLPSLISTWQSDPEDAPSLDVISQAANTLRLQDDYTNSRLLLEYTFQQQQQTQTLTPASYLALAEARIHTNDLPGALDLLRRLTLQGDLYENLDSAARLLERTNHFAEALPLLTKLSAGTPWDASYRLRLSKAQLAVKQSSDAQASLTTIASNDQASYATRAAAAQALHAVAGSKPFSSAELTLLSSSTPTAAQADQPYFVYARIAAASTAPMAQRGTILKAAIACAPAPLRDYLRVQIFNNEIAQSHFAQAETAIAPVLASQPTLVAASSATPEESAADDDVPSKADDTTTTALDNPYAITDLFASPQSRSTLLLTLATVQEHLNNPQRAITYLQTAQSLITDSTKHAALTPRIESLQNKLDLEQTNAARRPVFQSELRQTTPVRPRLTSLPKEAR